MRCGSGFSNANTIAGSGQVSRRYRLHLSKVGVGRLGSKLKIINEMVRAKSPLFLKGLTNIFMQTVAFHDQLSVHVIVTLTSFFAVFGSLSHAMQLIEFAEVSR